MLISEFCDKIEDIWEELGEDGNTLLRRTEYGVLSDIGHGTSTRVCTSTSYITSAYFKNSYILILFMS